MYSVQRSVGISAEFGGRYLPVVITDIPVFEIFQIYESVVLELKHNSETEHCHMNIDALPPEAKSSRLTLPQWLTIDPDMALNTKPGPISNQYAYLHNYDAWQYGFSIQKLYRSYHPDMEVAEELKTDLNLTKAGADYWEMGKYCLYTVNGLLHMGDANDNGVMIFQGAESGAIAGNNQVGILDFQHLGEIKTFSLTNDDVFARGGVKMRSATYLKLPEALNGRVPLLSVGGYLHALDGSYDLISDEIIKFDFVNYSWESRYLEMREYINLESLPSIYLGDGRYDLDILWSDTTIKALFTLPQSFIILVDAKELQRSDIQIEDSKLPGAYTVANKPLYPLMLGNGRLAEYRAQYQHGTSVMNVNGYLVDQPIRTTTGFRADHLMTAQLLPSDPTRLASAKQVILSKVIQE